MSKVEIELISEGVKELLRSPEIEAVVKNEADSICSRCGTGYTAESRTYLERKGFVIKPVSSEAMRDNLNNNTLLKAARI